MDKLEIEEMPKLRNKTKLGCWTQNQS